jgi:hypothetical protein
MLWHKLTKFVLEFCGLGLFGILAVVDTATLSCFNRNFSMSFDISPLPLYRRIFLRKILSIYVNWKILKNATHIHLSAIAIDYRDRTQATTHCCLEPFWWGSLRGWDFRPQLVVVSCLFGGNPFVDGILGHNLLLSEAFLVGIPAWMGF